MTFVRNADISNEGSSRSIYTSALVRSYMKVAQGNVNRDQRRGRNRPPHRHEKRGRNGRFANYRRVRDIK
jgi:hypothetical protein